MSIVRPAGLNERRCIARENLGLYGSIVTIGTYNNHALDPSDLPYETVVKVLKACINEHPVLSTIIRDADTEKPLLVSASQMNINNHLQRIHIDNCGDSGDDCAKQRQRLLERIHNEPFKDCENVPPWRVYIAHLPPPSRPSPGNARFFLAFAISHALVDGSSGLAFHSTFSPALRNSANLEYHSGSIWTLELSDHTVLPPLESATTLPISWSFLLRPALNEFLPVWIKSVLGMKDSTSETVWCGATKRPNRTDGSTESLSTAVRTAVIPHRLMQQALLKCKSHGARFTGLVTHLTARSLSQALRRRGLEFEEFLAEVAIDLRKCIPSATGSMANYVSATTISMCTTAALKDDSGESLTDEEWDAIRRTTDHLAERSSTLADQPTALLKYLPNIRTWITKQATKPAGVSFGVSNLGVARGSSDSSMDNNEEWRLEGIAFSQSADGMGPPFNLNVASLEGGSTVLVVTWWPGMLGLEKVDEEEGFVEEMLEGVVEMMEGID